MKFSPRYLQQDKVRPTHASRASCQSIHMCNNDAKMTAADSKSTHTHTERVSRTKLLNGGNQLFRCLHCLGSIRGSALMFGVDLAAELLELVHLSSSLKSAPIPYSKKEV